VAGEIEGANRASAFVAHNGFYEINVNPLISMMSQVLTRRIGPLYSSDSQQVVAWIEEAKAYDKELADRRMQSLLRSGVVTRGEARRWAVTGEVSLPPRDDDDELIKVSRPSSESPPNEGDESAENKEEGEESDEES